MGRGDERGSIVMLSVLLIMVMTFILILFLDVSLLFLQRRQAQHLADSAAIAGLAGRVDEADLHWYAKETLVENIEDAACAVLIKHPQISTCPGSTRVEIYVDTADQQWVEVIVYLDAPTVGVRVLGIGQPTVPGRGIARITADATRTLLPR